MCRRQHGTVAGIYLFVFALSPHRPALAGPSASGCRLTEEASLLLETYPRLGLKLDNPPLPVGQESIGGATPCRVKAFFGRPMNSAVTPELAADAWLADNLPAFGVSGLAVRQLRATNLVSPSATPGGPPTPTFTAFAYAQTMMGLDVAGSTIYLLVAHSPGGATNSVVYAAAKGLVEAPIGGFADDTVDAPAALLIAQAAGTSLADWSAPELVVGPLADGAPLVRAWAVSGSNLDLEDPQAFTYFIDAADGSIDHVRNDVYFFADTTGVVTATITEPPLPDPRPGDPGPGEPGGPPQVQVPIGHAYIEMDVDGTCPLSIDCDGASAVSHADGSFAFPYVEDTNVALRAWLRDDASCASDEHGPWFNIISEPLGTPDPICANLPPTTPTVACVEYPDHAAEITFDFDCEYERAEVNAFYHLNLARDLFAQFLGDPETQLPGADCGNTVQVRVNKRISACGGFAALSPCPALGFGRSAADGTCVNTAYSTVLAHEFGHFLVWRFTGGIPVLGQGTFGEGYGDAWALLAYDVEAVGHGIVGPGTTVRDFGQNCPPATAPCTGTVPPACQGELYAGPALPEYACGKVLAGAWLDIRRNLDWYGWTPPDNAVQAARQLFVSFTMIAPLLDTTAGQSGLNADDELLPIAVLSVDDAFDFGGDTTINNGTPHEAAICNAFELRGFACDHTYVLAYPIGSRYLSLQLTSIDGTSSDRFSIRLRGRASSPAVDCVDAFVTADGTLGAETYRTAAEWNTVFVHGSEIVPSASYDVEVYRDGTPPELAAFSAVRTRPLGDVTGDFVVTNLDDILCVLAAFGGNFTQCTLESADSMPCEPNGLVNLDDILAVLSGFAGGSLNCPAVCP